MARKFVTTKELAFIDVINRELIQHVTGQEVVYYAILRDGTQVDDLYNEAVQKTWASPVRITGRVLYGNENVLSTNLGQDSQHSLEVYFHTMELKDRNVNPQEGDVLEFGQVFFEITSVTKPQPVFGQIQDRLMTKCMCVISREGHFKAGGSTEDSVDNSHPVESRVHENE